MFCYVNGTWSPEEDATIPLQEMGFLYGDSLFETIRVTPGGAFRLDKHLARLRSGMETIRLEGLALLGRIPVLVTEIIARNQIRTGLLRVIVTRGALEGQPWDSGKEPNLYLLARPLSPPPVSPATVVFYPEEQYPILRFRPAIKSGNYLGNLLAKGDAARAGAYEPVFYDRDHWITECAIRNVFFFREDTLLTPTTELGVLPGVIRDTVLELAQRTGYSVEETHIAVDEANRMSEAFITSTGIGILPVTWDGYRGSYDRTRHLQTQLNELFEKGPA